jgi:hypothetical protein
VRYARRPHGGCQSGGYRIGFTRLGIYRQPTICRAPRALRRQLDRLGRRLHGANVRLHRPAAASRVHRRSPFFEDQSGVVPVRVDVTQSDLGRGDDELVVDLPPAALRVIAALVAARGLRVLPERAPLQLAGRERPRWWIAFWAPVTLG